MQETDLLSKSGYRFQIIDVERLFKPGLENFKFLLYCFAAFFLKEMLIPIYGLIDVGLFSTKLKTTQKKNHRSEKNNCPKRHHGSFLKGGKKVRRYLQEVMLILTWSLNIYPGRESSHFNAPESLIQFLFFLPASLLIELAGCTAS